MFAAFFSLCPSPCVLFGFSWHFSWCRLFFFLAHMLYGNWLAPVLSAFGGLLFAFRYSRSRSTIIAAIEHGLWGNYLFTVGYGWFFYSGAIQ